MIIITSLVLSFFLASTLLKLNFLSIKPYPNINKNKPIFEIKENLLYRYEIHRYAALAEITDLQENQTNLNLGVSVDVENFNFGKMPKTSKAYKSVNMTNNGNKEYTIKVYSFGNISDLLEIESVVKLMPKENKELGIVLVTDIDTKEGNYTGEIVFVTEIPKKVF